MDRRPALPLPGPVRGASRLLAALAAVLLLSSIGGCAPGDERDGTAFAAEAGSTDGPAGTRFEQEPTADAGGGVDGGGADAGARSPGTAAARGDAGPGPGRSVQEAGIAAERRNAIVTAARRVSPSVVTINVIRTRRVRPRSLFESFFAPPGARRMPGFGSGFVVDADEGIVLTNEHVVRGAEQIMVTLPDGRDLEAEMVGADELVDIAVLRVDAADLPEAPLGTSEGLIIGEWALAIGNPFGTMVSNTEPTLTAGVVSALDRHIVPNSDEQGFYLGMIQTDASINPGNSGGPLVNALGQVIGVNSSIFSRGGGSEGLGFAIPIDRALRVAEDILAYGEVRRAWLGLDVEPVDADAWGRTRGVRVSRVVEASPAARAGLRPGDRLMAADGRRLTTPLDFENILLDLRAGDAIALRVEGRDGAVRLRAESLPSSRAERIAALRDLDVITVTPQVRAERGIVSEQGALVVSVSPELRQQLGFQPGDVIVRVDNTPIRSAAELAEYFERLRGSGRVVLYFERNGSYVMRPFYWNG